MAGEKREAAWPARAIAKLALGLGLPFPLFSNLGVALMWARYLDDEGDDTDVAQWSPDGTQILFDGRGDVEIMRSDGSRRRRLTCGGDVDSYPAWSSDDRWIVFARGPRERGDRLFSRLFVNDERGPTCAAHIPERLGGHTAVVGPLTNVRSELPGRPCHRGAGTKTSSGSKSSVRVRWSTSGMSHTFGRPATRGGMRSTFVPQWIAPWWTW